MLFPHPEVYHPAEDTRLLLNAALGIVRSSDRVVEIGTGSGEIAHSLAHVADCVIATDINPHAVSLASRRGVVVIRTDLFSGICTRFDLVIFNPPYLPTEPGDRIDDWLEYALDGGIDGRATIERFLDAVPDYLSLNGKVLLLVSSLSGVGEVAERFRANGMISMIVAEEQLEGETLFVFLGMRDLCSV
ncbi:MAG: methylase [Methanocalculus sp. MSAO_Arc2]|uniref:HemK2/MTQ2 family protein methyltransferase n=1 Tax=Methanocalculus sp. MSAO_Arc2 TaxID=2293855 RepID=UPI000FEEB464|nr:MAG: methylase [Methanocalculus sp. MSAO_Arc2]